MKLTAEDLEEMARELAGLPTELPFEEEDAKRFDSLMYRLQPAQLHGGSRFLSLANQLRSIAGLPEEKGAV